MPQRYVGFQSEVPLRPVRAKRTRELWLHSALVSQVPNYDGPPFVRLAACSTLETLFAAFQQAHYAVICNFKNTALHLQAKYRRCVNGQVVR